MKTTYYILIIMILLTNCDGEESYIPNVFVNLHIDLSLPEYSSLDILGNSMFIEGGNAGIIIYHFAINEYKIYDRNCSYEPSLDCAYIDSINTSIAYCGCCTSAFLLDQDGAAANAPALLPLKKYNWNLQGDQLYIFN